ncbi:MAG: 3-phosphoshikimate 1-carboxyvinyltransferase, partial [Planctomycetota bacterium]|nr:3-phosphoshikimate 1-carboxyvinyltransferase [Planctomycetota bacterium]
PLADKRNKTTVLIQGKGLDGWQESVKPICAGESGTTARLLCGLLAGQKFPSVLTGSKTLLTRPMGRVIEPLRLMGARIDTPPPPHHNCLPVHIYPSQLRPIRYTLPVPSAQVKSAILLAGLFATGTTVVREPVPSRDHTERLLELMGARIRKTGQRIAVKRTDFLKPLDIYIPGDFSSSAYFIAAALLVPDSEIVIKDVGLNPYRTGLLTVLKKMGARYVVSRLGGMRQDARPPPVGRAGKTQDPRRYEPVGDIIVRYSSLKGVTVSGGMIPLLVDEIPILSLIATQAKGVTIIEGAGELRVKESDRIRTVCEELSKLGADIRETEDGMVIKGPTRLRGARCSSHGDHRIAMMLSIAGLITQGRTTITGMEVVNKSFPTFTQMLSHLVV